VKRGQGVYTWPSGERHEGMFDNYADGQGKRTLADGSMLEGNFKVDKLHGHGIKTAAPLPEGQPISNGFGNLRECGEYVEGLLHGQAEVNFRNGCTYVGQFEAGVKRGQGVFTWPNGDRYEGSFSNVRDGRGKQVFADGRVYDGEWKDDKFLAV
jgi:hypothetical protein